MPARQEHPLLGFVMTVLFIFILALGINVDHNRAAAIGVALTSIAGLTVTPAMIERVVPFTAPKAPQLVTGLGQTWRIASWVAFGVGVLCVVVACIPPHSTEMLTVGFSLLVLSYTSMATLYITRSLYPAVRGMLFTPDVQLAFGGACFVAGTGLQLLAFYL